MLTSLHNRLSVPKWWISFAKKLFRVTPRELLLSTFLSVSSQILQVVSLLLPLKIVLLAGSPTVPAYFPSIFHGIGRDYLIGGLCAASVVMYLCHLAAERYLHTVTSSGAEKLIRANRKLAIHSNQESIASIAYKRFSTVASSLVFIVLSFLGLLFISPTLVGVIVIYLSAWGLKPNRSRAEVQDTTVHDEEGAHNSRPKTVAGLGFLLVFLFLAYQTANSQSFSALSAILTLLVSRQAFGQIARLIGGMNAINRDRVRLTAIFFTHRPWHLGVRTADKLETLIAAEERDKWIQKAISETAGTSSSPKEVAWLQTSGRDALLFRVKTDAQPYEIFFVKIFSERRALLADREAALLANQPDLPAPTFCGATYVSGLPCHVFRLDQGYDRPITDVQSFRTQLAHALGACKPTSALLKLSAKTQGQIWQRMANHVPDRICAFMGERADAEAMAEFSQLIKAVCERLASVPASIHVRSFAPAFGLVSSDRASLFAHWVAWTVEPIGFGWHHGPDEMRENRERFLELGRTRSDVRSVRWEDVELSILCSAYERYFNAWMFEDAYLVAQRIVTSFKKSAKD